MNSGAHIGCSAAGLLCCVPWRQSAHGGNKPSLLDPSAGNGRQSAAECMRAPARWAHSTPPRTWAAGSCAGRRRCSRAAPGTRPGSGRRTPPRPPGAAPGAPPRARSERPACRARMEPGQPSLITLPPSRMPCAWTVPRTWHACTARLDGWFLQRPRKSATCRACKSLAGGTSGQDGRGRACMRERAHAGRSPFLLGLLATGQLVPGHARE